VEFERLIEIVGDAPEFETGLLLAGDVDARDVRRQLSRWSKAGRLYRLRRGLYALAPPFQKVKPHPFVVANQMVRGSYVSCQSALSFYGLIPEHVPVTTSVMAKRPARWDTPLGAFQFRRLKPELLYGYRWTNVIPGQSAFVASPEKALLDLIYLQPGGDRSEYVRTLRLQDLAQLNRVELRRQANLSRRPKLQRAVQVVLELASLEEEGMEGR
jgi:predicted transcriptional regulator of viral defense system